jgi:cell division protein ZapA (FtsZ GTPase activity inhibitor)
VHQVTKRQIALTLDELSIKVNIADRTYPLSVKPDEEEKVRKAAKLINDKLKEYSTQFAVRDKQDILSMCTLEIATALISLQEAGISEDQSLSVQLSEIAKLLKDVTI